MRGLYLIFKKELKSYFTSPVAYVVITIFLVVTGYFFYAILASFSRLSFDATVNPMLAKQLHLLNITETVVRPLFGNISVIMLLVVPILTMRLFSEEKKTGTMELLLTYPLTDMQVLMGKFLASLVVLVAMLLLTILHPILIMAFGEPELWPIITGYIGLFLMGMAFISLGIFASSLTENQVIAATLSFGVLIIFWVMGFSIGLTGPTLERLLSYTALTEHLEGFAKGVVEIEDIIYYLVFTILFLFLTLRILESKRWRG